MFLRSNVLEMEWRLESYYYCTGDACTVYRCLQSISCHMVADCFSRLSQATSLSPEDRKRTAAGSQLLPRTLPCSKSHPPSQANTSLQHHRDPNPHVPSLVSENTAETMTLANPPLLPTFATATSLVIGGFSATARNRRRSIRSPKARSSCWEQKNSTVFRTGRRPLYRRAHASC